MSGEEQQKLMKDMMTKCDELFEIYPVSDKAIFTIDKVEHYKDGFSDQLLDRYNILCDVDSDIVIGDVIHNLSTGEFIITDTISFSEILGLEDAQNILVTACMFLVKTSSNFSSLHSITLNKVTTEDGDGFEEASYFITVPVVKYENYDVRDYGW